MQYNKLNNLLGWLCFLIASVTYILTLEPSVSFWDCGEFISCAYKLQVSHQPGYPLFWATATITAPALIATSGSDPAKFLI